MARFRQADPEAIGPYRVERLLGIGGMGRVYLGVDGDGNRAAVKVVNPELLRDEEFYQRFSREAAATAAVSGRFIAGIVGSDLDGAQPWLATEYIDGPALSTVVTDKGPMTPAEAQEIAAGLAEALATIHAAGVVHRDVKPANVLLAAHGPYLIDFGIARDAAASTITRTGIVVGTPPYMAPEQIRGHRKIGPPADVFALGGVLTFAITGRHPFGEGDPASLAYRIAHEDPDLDGIDDDLIRALISACLAKSPDDRPTAPELQERLGSVATRPVRPAVPSQAASVTPTQPMTAAEAQTEQDAAPKVAAIGSGAAVTGEAPDGTGDAPEATDDAPNATSDAPNRTGDAPEATDEAPDAEAPQQSDAQPADAALRDQNPAEPIGADTATAAGAPRPATTAKPLPPAGPIGPNRRRRVAVVLAVVLIVVAGAGVLGTELMQGGGKNSPQASGRAATGGAGIPTDSSTDSGSGSASPPGTTSASISPTSGPNSSAPPPPSPTGLSGSGQNQPSSSDNVSIPPDGTVTTTANGRVTTIVSSPHTTTSKSAKPPTSNPPVSNPPTSNPPASNPATSNPPPSNPAPPPHGDRPSTPTGDTPTVTTNSSFSGFVVTFTWSAVPGATSYDVHYTYDPTPGQPNTVDQIVNVSGSPYSRSDYTAYPVNACFVVRAVNAYGVSAWDSATPHCV